MPNCKNCGGPLKRGNIKWERPPIGRPFRVHRHCPKANERRNDITSEAIQPTGRKVTLNDVEGNPTVVSREFVVGTAGSPLQRSQDSTGGPVTVEAVFQHSTPLKYRYFVNRKMAEEKIQRAFDRGQGAVTVEIISVPDYQVEADPEALADYVEIEFKRPTD